MTADTGMAQQVVRRLAHEEPTTDEAVTPPKVRGFYAWWARKDRLADAFPAIPLVPHETEREWSLLYVGIVPRNHRGKRQRTLLDRVTGDHRRGNVGSSTFRLSLGALLVRHLNLRPLSGHTRVRFQDERSLSLWMKHNCGAAWAQCPEPWLYEEEVIGRLHPPFNLRPGAHDFRFRLEEARAALRSVCGL